jgi:hypothetical protein
MIWRFVDPVGLNMLDSRLLRLLDALASLLFLVAAALIVLLTSQVKYHDGNYPLFYFGFGVLLECVYLAIHFALKTIFSSRASLAARISRILGLLLLVPIGLIVLILAVLIAQSIRTFEDYDREAPIEEFIFAILVLLMLVVPAFLIVRDAVISFLRQRAERRRATDSPQT